MLRLTAYRVWIRREFWNEKKSIAKLWIIIKDIKKTNKINIFEK